MKKNVFFAIAMAISFTTLGQSYHGEKITDQNSISTGELVKQIEGKDSLVTKVTGQVESVCKVKGCWMKVKLDDGTTMRVSFKDYGFFVPKDIAGKSVVIEGLAKVKETSVKDLKHFAEDAGKNKEEIAKLQRLKKH